MGVARSELLEVKKRTELYLSLSRFDAAEKLLKATLADYGPLANIHNLLGLTFHKQSKFVEAIREFNQALVVNPEFLEAALNLAATLCDVSRYEEANQVFAKLEERVGDRQKQPGLVLGRLANMHVAAGQAYVESGMLQEAIQEYRKALSLYDKMPDVKLNLAKLYVKVGQHEKAKQEFEELVNECPWLSDAHTWLGILQYKLGQRDLAKMHWEKAQESAPEDSTARAYLKFAGSWTGRSRTPED
ncbi:MAG: tetratricopeptide repeat protein [Deltaproteobacteria bacterium]|nr:tetratricopeptide repeat protein [Deltaproteobacteria bacterium]